MGAAITSEDAEHFVPQPQLAKDFYARHLSSQPDFAEEYTGCQDYFIRRALAATRANLVQLQPKVWQHHKAVLILCVPLGQSRAGVAEHELDSSLA